MSITEVNIKVEDIASTDPTKIIKLVSIAGQLDESNVDEKAKQIYELITQNPKNLNVILNFESLDYMNSKSIGYLTDWYGKITENNGKLVVAKAKPNITDILTVVGLTQLITFYNTLEEAKFALTTGA